MQLKLLVIRSPNSEKLTLFYNLLGLKFDYHKHGNSPFHYSTLIGETVLEIYPLAKNQTEPDKNLRLGFSIDNFDATIQTLKNHAVLFAAEPMQTDFGFMVIVIDSDGRKVELYKK